MRQNYSSRCRTHIQWGLIIALIGLFNLQGKAQAYSGGSGTSSDPYQISTLDDLKYLSENTDQWNKHFVLTADINANETKDWNDGEGFSPISNYSVYFYGTFNGAGYSISNLYINRPEEDYQGLFGYVYTGSVNDLLLLDVDITGNNSVGGLAGYFNGSSQACVVTGNVVSNQRAGGFAGYTVSATIQNCFSTAEVTAERYLGGFVGYSSSSNFSNCYSSGTVSGTSYSGGFLGINYSSLIKDCYYNKETSGKSDSSKGTGINTIDFASESSFNNWEFSGVWNISTLNDFADSAYPYLAHQFTRNAVNFTVVDEDSAPVEGASVYSTLGESLAITDASGTATVYLMDGDYNLTVATEYLQSAIISFTVNGASLNQSVSLTSKGLTPPALEYDGGTGTVNDPYQIANLAQLRKLSETSSQWSSSNNFVLTDNIDATETKDWNLGEGFSPIGHTSFSFGANFDGQGHYISNLCINRPDVSYQGLFGRTSLQRTSIKDVHLIGVNVIGYQYVGGLVGLNQYTTVSNCSVNGIVEGKVDYVGGLIGDCYYGQDVEYCYSNAEVIGRSEIGGLIGNINGSTSGNVEVKNCFAFGSVSSTSYGGGLIGYQSTYSMVSNCYSAVSVSGSIYSSGGLIGYKTSYNTATLSACYYDKQVSGMSDRGKGTGLETADFADAGNFGSWDFSDIWVITKINDLDSENEYPYQYYMLPVYAINITVKDVDGVVVEGSKIYDANNSEIGESDATGLITLELSMGEYNLFIGNESLASRVSFTVVDEDLDLDVSLQELTVAATEYEGGTGTGEDPYQIANLAQLRKLSETSQDWDKHFELIAAIDATETELWNIGSGFSTIGNYSTMFSGSFNGQDYSISSLYINQPSNYFIGLFGCTLLEGSLSHISLVDAQISGQGHVGTLVGANEATISNCSASGSVNATNNYSGGLVGYNGNTITNSYASCNVVSKSNSVGGLVGHCVSSNAIVSNCYATGSVYSTSYDVGGLVGYVNTLSVVENSYANAEVSTVSSSKGGLIGTLYGQVINSYYNTETSGMNDTGKGIGLETADFADESNFTDWDFSLIWTIATLDQIDENNDYPYFHRNFTSNKLTIITVDTEGNPVSDAYLTNMSGQIIGAANNAGEVVISLVNGSYQIIVKSEYTESETLNITLSDSDHQEQITLSANNITGPDDDYEAGSGTSSDPYQISNIAQLRRLSETNSDWSKHFVLIADIDASETKDWNNGEGFSPIGNYDKRFYGSFNGSSYSISGLSINRPTGLYQGLFGYVSNGTVSDLLVLDVDITAYQYVGGLAGYFTANAQSCATTGSIVSDSYAGGFAGYINSGVVQNCFTTVAVTAERYLGGFTGSCANNSKCEILNCYATGVLTGSIFSGGFIGSKGFSSIVSNCYYNKETTGKSDTGKGTGINTADFADESNFTNWDFNSVWNITTLSDFADSDYPYLALQFPRYAVNFTVVDEDSTPVEDAIVFNSLGTALGNTNTDGTVSINLLEGDYSLIVLTEYLESDTLKVTVEDSSQDILVALNDRGLTAPSLRYDGGTGIQSDPYQIANLAQLRKLSENVYDWYSSRYFVLTADIDAEESKDWNFGKGFSPIGNLGNSFQGDFDGQGHSISNLCINRPNEEHQGFFGYVSSSTNSIKNVHLKDVNIKGEVTVGGLMGINYYTDVSNCSVSGTVQGIRGEIGGLIGKCYYDQTIEYCYSNTEVIGSANVGGLIGIIYGSYYSGDVYLKNCYALGSVSSSGDYVGGLLGYQGYYSSLTNCYASASVEGRFSLGGLIGSRYNTYTTITSCYYDKDVSGMLDTGNGIGLETTDFANESNFTNWDFEDTWNIAILLEFDLNNEYPYFKSQFKPYTISFDANGGEGTMTPIEDAEGTTTLPLNTLLKTDYTFVGWSLSAGGTVNYADGAAIGSSEDITLYAVWELTTYQVTFDANGGSGTMSPMEEAIGVVTLSSNEFTNVGYDFLGW